MNQFKKINIVVAGLGNVGSHVITSILDINKNSFDKTKIDFNIIGISAKDKTKQRIFNIEEYNWVDNPLDLIDLPNCDILIELIGEEKGISYDLIKKALEKKIHVVTANKALLSINGKKLFDIADKNQTQLLFEAAVGGGIPIIKILKQSIFLNKIYKISGILNGTTNFILSEMENKNLNFEVILKDAQKNGYAESNPTNDIEGIDSAHKLSLLSTLCFGSEIDFDNISCNGISEIDIDDIRNANKLGYKIKLISESELINNKITSIVEPKLIKKESHLANINGVLNAIKIESNHLNPLILEGEGAGGKATASSIISDIYEISLNNLSPSLGVSVNDLNFYDNLDSSSQSSSFYLRIMAKDITGVLAKITSHLNDQGISIETILQIPDKNISNNCIPIIIVTHMTTKKLLLKALNKIEKLDFVLNQITVITIDNNLD